MFLTLYKVLTSDLKVTQIMHSGACHSNSAQDTSLYCNVVLSGKTQGILYLGASGVGAHVGHATV